MVFVIGLLLLEQTYDFIFANGVIRSKHQKVQSLEEGEYFEYVFLGSSRTENSIDCEVVEQITGKPCINLGISGSSLQDSYVLLKLLIAKGVKVKHVFVQVDYSYNEKDITLSPAFKATLIPYRKNPVIREQLLKEEDGPYILNVPFYGYLKYEKVVGFREFFNQTIRNKTGRNYENGFFPLTGTGKKLYGSLPSEIADKNNSLVEIQQLMSQQEANLYYFLAPYCSEVKNREYAKKLQDKLPEMFNYIDIFDRKENFFADCGHINLEGAKEFTKILITDFLQRETKAKN
ncbi:hypothetical protein OQ279_04865 [Salinimicrobium sp. MT39]|uniref:Uncharacterized protein n=1 Tax=Salinimicrobium profundisediminis TaxID=2994553 RepID=A0A9X3CV82_9FLAO|nr:hypothetical protein [Salinimicrobium profundisediminis]MCX2837476.1 hypothetical protein [Salinimicrobium profundisediminis]